MFPHAYICFEILACNVDVKVVILQSESFMEPLGVLYFVGMAGRQKASRVDS